MDTLAKYKCLQYPTGTMDHCTRQENITLIQIDQQTCEILYTRTVKNCLQTAKFPVLRVPWLSMIQIPLNVKPRKDRGTYMREQLN